MKQNYIQRLKCVRCHSERMTIYSISSVQDEVMEGLVLCTQCNTAYPIISGLPCFLLPELRNKDIIATEKYYLNQIGNANLKTLKNNIDVPI